VPLVKKNKMGGHVACMVEGRGVHWVLVGKPEGNRPFGRARNRREDNIMMDLQKLEGSHENWMELSHDTERWLQLLSTGMKLRVP
jgi:hypothetical protein